MRKKWGGRIRISSFIVGGALAAACGGGDDAQDLPGDAGSGTDSGPSNDATIGDGGSGTDSGSKDSGLCTDGGTACGDTCVDAVHDKNNCGACDAICFAGQICAASSCSGAEPAEHVRAMAPLSGMMTTTRKPTFKWELPAGFDNAHAQICSDRACTAVIADVIGTTSGKPSADLPAGRVFWRLFGRLGAHEATTPSVVWTLTIPQVSAPHESSPKITRDVNGDGLGDIALDAAGSSVSVTDDAGTTRTELGVKYIFLGQATAPSSAATAMLSPPPGPNGSFGMNVSFAGDVDGDGYADLVSGSKVNSGSAVYSVDVYTGGVSGPHSNAYAAFAPLAGTFKLDYAWGLGDVNGDGFSDFAGLEQPAGTHDNLQAFFGGPPNGGDAGTLVFTNPLQTINFGIAGVCLGDLNQDGYADFALGDTSDDGPSASIGGHVYVLLGSAAGFSPAAYTALVGAGTSLGQFGAALDSGDIDGDGYPDLAVGAPNESGGNGNIYVFRGTSGGISVAPSWILHGNVDAGVSQRQLGIGMAVADFDGDGYDDIAAGATNEVVIYKGSATGPSLVPVITIPNQDVKSNSFFGYDLGSPLDANADGISDLVVTAFGGTLPANGYFFPGSGTGLPTTPTAMLHGAADVEFTWVGN